MVVAITYDKETGNVGQHFGHADFFKLYEIENGRIMDSAVVAPFGQGHEAVASTMDDYSVSLVICQNIGDGAMQALSAYGIAVCPNVEGLADDAIEAFMQGSYITDEEILSVLASMAKWRGKLLRRRKFLRLHLRGLLSLIDNSKRYKYNKRKGI